MEKTKLWEGLPPGHEEGFHIPHIKYFPQIKETSEPFTLTFSIIFTSALVSIVSNFSLIVAIALVFPETLGSFSFL